MPQVYYPPLTDDQKNALLRALNFINDIAGNFNIGQRFVDEALGTPVQYSTDDGTITGTRDGSNRTFVTHQEFKSTADVIFVEESGQVWAVASIAGTTVTLVGTTTGPASGVLTAIGKLKV